jgi:uncharacterized membrane protein
MAANSEGNTQDAASAAAGDQHHGLPAGAERLSHELMGFLGAQLHRAADAATSRVSELSGRLGETATGAAQDLPKAAAGAVGKAAAGHAKDTAKEKVKGLFGGLGGLFKRRGRGGGPGKVTNIIEHIDVGLPLRDCYNHWTVFEEFSDFMKGVRSARRDENDETASDWELKVGPSNRNWHATVQEQVPDERIQWTSEGPKGTTHGEVSFHELAPRLTRIVVVVEYHQVGFVEKTGNLWHAQGRRLRLDLKHFQRHVTLQAEEVPEGWRGEIRDGEVVRGHEDVLAEERGEQPGEEKEKGAKGEKKKGRREKGREKEGRRAREAAEEDEDEEDEWLGEEEDEEDR